MINFKTKGKAALFGAVLGILSLGLTACNTITDPGTSVSIEKVTVSASATSIYYGDSVTLTATPVFSDTSYTPASDAVSYHWEIKDSETLKISKDTTTPTFTYTQDFTPAFITVKATFNGKSVESTSIDVGVKSSARMMQLKENQPLVASNVYMYNLFSKISGTIAFETTSDFSSKYKIECNADAALGATFDSSTKILTLNGTEEVSNAKVTFKFYVESGSTKTYIPNTDLEYSISTFGTTTSDYQISVLSDMLSTASGSTKTKVRVAKPVTSNGASTYQQISDYRTVYYADVTSSDTSVISVNATNTAAGIELVALKAGSADITVKVGGKIETTKVTVDSNLALETKGENYLRYNSLSKSITVGKSYDYAISGKTVTVKPVSSDAATYVTVSGTTITATNTTGTATLSLTEYYADGDYIIGKVIPLTVKVCPKATKVTITPESLDLAYSEYKSIGITVEPSDALKNDVVYTLSGDTNKPTITTNSQTIVTAGTGDYTGTLTATIDGVTSDAVTVTVTNRPTAMNLNHTGYVLKYSDSTSLAPVFTPNDASVKTGITWTSSNTDVATIDSDGKVTSKDLTNGTTKNGGCTLITATSEGGLKATCIVVVIDGATFVAKDSLSSYIAGVDSGSTTTDMIQKTGCTARIYDPNLNTVNYNSSLTVITEGIYFIETNLNSGKPVRVDVAAVTNSTETTQDFGLLLGEYCSRFDTGDLSHNNIYNSNSKMIYGKCAGCNKGAAFLIDSTQYGSKDAGTAVVDSTSMGVGFKNLSVNANATIFELTVGKGCTSDSSYNSL